MTEPATDAWDSGQAYEQYVGRWSRQVAVEFVRWIAAPSGLAWADVGCGTGALSATILALCDPSSVRGIDLTDSFVADARTRVKDPRAGFETGDAMDLPWDGASRDVAVSGLVLNFVTDPQAMVRQMARVTKPGGSVAAYVWDYAGGMEMIRHFWDAAIATSPNAAGLDEGKRFPLCQPAPLRELFERVQLKGVVVHPIDIPTVFRDFDDYWKPFLGRTGPAPAYVASLSEEARERLRHTLQSRLASSGSGSLAMTARAWAVKGTV